MLGGGVAVSERDYLLAVTDKAMELIEDDAARRRACSMDIMAAWQGIALAIAAAARNHPAPLAAASVREFQFECLIGTYMPRPAYWPAPLSMGLVRASASSAGIRPAGASADGTPEITCACNSNTASSTLPPDLTITRVTLPSSDGTRVGVFLPYRLARGLTRTKVAEAQGKCLAGMIAAVETLPVHVIKHPYLDPAKPVWETGNVTVDHTPLRSIDMDGLLVLFWRVISGSDGHGDEYVRRAERRVDCAIGGYVAASAKYKLEHGFARGVRREVGAFVRLATREEPCVAPRRDDSTETEVNGSGSATGNTDGVEALVLRMCGLTL